MSRMYTYIILHILIYHPVNGTLKTENERSKGSFLEQTKHLLILIKNSIYYNILDRQFTCWFRVWCIYL